MVPSFSILLEKPNFATEPARVHEQLLKISDNPKLVRSFFKHPSVAYITDC